MRTIGADAAPTVNDVPIFKPLHQVNITISPVHAPVSITIPYNPGGGSTTFTWPAVVRGDGDVTVPAESYVNVGDTLTFTARVSGLINATVGSYLWDFGDGTTATTSTATHQYKVAGRPSTTVRLAVTDDQGITAYASRTLIWA